MRFSMVAAAAFLASAGIANAANLVTNGDFEAGNTGFTSGYAYTAPGAGNLYPEATYTVDTDPTNSHNLFSSFGDHTTGTGNFMIVNGSGTQNVSVWSNAASIAVTPGKSYSFTAWISSVYPDSPAQLQFTVGGVDLGTFTAPGTTGMWQQVGGIFTAGPTDTLVTLSIINQNTALGGNDFGIDDISFSAAVPEPGTWAMLMLGFGLVGVSARRRKAAVAA